VGAPGEELSAAARKNRAYWDAQSDAYQERHGPQIAGGMGWGVWQIPEAELGVLGDVAGLDVLELGCGAAQWSIALARRGARATGLDVSPCQLEHARRAVDAAGVDVRLVEASAERTPLADEAFDVVFCDHGAFNFANPRRVVPEAARLLRPGGLLAFCMASPLVDLFWDSEGDGGAGTELRNSYFELSGFENEETAEYQLPYGEWIRLFRASGFIVEDLIELRAPADGETTYDFVDRAWARRWPAENIWKARRAV
jgi:SAM-dependent methyltransferase